ncbi:MAG TPA: hypothetical protein VKZ60_00855 [Chloroflexota bacterium]|jgi:hypothetical protein|nr:hypothetical protein [Chloroflexota bacterium]
MLGRAFAPGPNDLPRGVPAPGPLPPRHPVSLSVGDGFKFGCGFVLALVVAVLAGLVFLSLLVLLATLMGADLLSLFQRR